VTATEVELPQFEFTDPLDELREATAASPHATQVDVLLRATDATSKTHLAFVEVKLSEDDFGGCSAYLSERNPRRSICRHSGWFGTNPAGCFQLANHDREHRRRYEHYLLDPPKELPHRVGCCFRGGANQVMRNIALARVLLARHEADSVTVALTAPESHSSIWRRWTENQELSTTGDRVTFAEPPASAVLQFHPVDQAKQLAVRYLLDPGSVGQR
jgi:hypothetical protein